MLTFRKAVAVCNAYMDHAVRSSSVVSNNGTFGGLACTSQ
jgi:hypothetical protein